MLWWNLAVFIRSIIYDIVYVVCSLLSVRLMVCVTVYLPTLYKLLETVSKTVALKRR